jgi:hypothetical protein
MNNGFVNKHFNGREELLEAKDHSTKVWLQLA